MGKNKYYCRYNGKIYNLSDIQECIDKNDCLHIDTLLMTNHGWDFIDAINFEDILELNNNEIPVDYNEALEKLRAKNRALYGVKKTNVPRCPRCGSTSITTGPRGFSSFWALITGLTGGDAVQAGLIGSGNTVNRCAKCGHTWKPK